MDLEDDTEAYTAILQDVLRPAAPDAAALDAWVTTLVELSLKQRAELIFGEVNGVQPPDVVKRNGMAYLEGWDTFAEIGSLFTRCARRTRDPAPRERRAAADLAARALAPESTLRAVHTHARTRPRSASSIRSRSAWASKTCATRTAPTRPTTTLPRCSVRAVVRAARHRPSLRCAC